MTTPDSSGQAATTGGGLRITRADHVALRVADDDETIRFYTTKLNFQLEAEWTLGDDAPGVRLAYVRLGAFMIEIVGDGRPTPLPASRDIDEHLSRSGYVHLCLRVEALDETLAMLRNRGVEVFVEPFVVEPIGQRLAMVKDNSGNVIELAEAVEA
jgi:catechol 2,3-dioxygenase-like lactoylglutathione lyase family enzyme